MAKRKRRRRTKLTARQDSAMTGYAVYMAVLCAVLVGGITALETAFEGATWEECVVAFVPGAIGGLVVGLIGPALFGFEGCKWGGTLKK